jgi:hypothetical protein
VNAFKAKVGTVDNMGEKDEDKLLIMQVGGRGRGRGYGCDGHSCTLLSPPPHHHHY